MEQKSQGVFIEFAYHSRTPHNDVFPNLLPTLNAEENNMVHCLCRSQLVTVGIILIPAMAQAQPRPSGDPAIIPAGAQLETVFDGGSVLTEGVAAAPDGTIYFSDITFTYQSKDERGVSEAGHIWKYDPRSGKTTIFRSPSGMSNGINVVYSPQGKELAYIPTEIPTNAGFGRGAESKTLYVTAGKSLYRIRLNKASYQLPPRE